MFIKKRREYKSIELHCLLHIFGLHHNMQVKYINLSTIELLFKVKKNVYPLPSM